jgi:hypothetical protein
MQKRAEEYSTTIGEIFEEAEELRDWVEGYGNTLFQGACERQGVINV